MQWQPIDTAPKDGREFLAYDRSTKKMDVCYMQQLSPNTWVCSTTQSYGDYGPDSDEFGYDTSHISHWMPLPPPPVNDENNPIDTDQTK